MPDLSKALAPLLSPAYRSFLRSRSWARRAPYDLGPRISSLSIRSDSRSSPGLGMSASTFGPAERTTTPRGHLDIMGGLFGSSSSNNKLNSGVRSCGLESFSNVGASFSALSAMSKSASVLRPSRLSDAFSCGRQSSERKQRKQSKSKQSQVFGESYNLTPPPSQDSSFSSSEGEFSLAAAFLDWFSSSMTSQDFSV